MIPVIALIGRTNVGKSTLFNRLTRTRDALVADFPGLTRDRKYGLAKWKGHEFIVIDTGGIDGTEEGVELHMAVQSLVAIEEANIVLFIVDGRTGLMAADQGIAKHLRIYQKTTIIVANKTEWIDINSAVSDFYVLGMSDIVPIAASHGIGINDLLDQVLLLLVNNSLLVADDMKNAVEALVQEKKNKPKETPVELQSLPIKLAIIGCPNVGKSTLTNCILGKERVVVYNMPGTTRDSIYIPMVRDKQEYVLIDTAGVRNYGKITSKVEKFSIVKTLQAIENANVVLFIIDAHKGISNQDLSLLCFILNSGRSLVIAVNKWDSMSNDVCNEVKEALNQRLGFVNFVRIHFVSAMYGSGINNLFESINEAYQCATKRVKTALLTHIMRIAVEKHQPPMVHGRRVKPKYAHAGGYNPPIIVIHGTQVKELPDSYKRYLINCFRRSLKIMGTPIRLQFNETANPFVGQRNTLMLTRFRKRKRYMSHTNKSK